MQRTSDHIWICFGPGDDHALHAATICAPGSTPAEGTIARFDAPDGADRDAQEQRDAVVYFHGPGGFCQQPATLTPVEFNGAPAFRFEPAGIAALAEDRVAQRFTVEPMGVAAVLAGDDVCPVHDVSPRGLSVTSERGYDIGQVLEIAFETPSDGGVHMGYCRVRSLKASGEGQRYGLLALDGADGGSLGAGLREIIDWVRRNELRRMPKAG